MSDLTLHLTAYVAGMIVTAFLFWRGELEVKPSWVTFPSIMLWPLLSAALTYAAIRDWWRS